MAPKKGTTPAAAQPTSMVKWEEEMARQADIAAAATAMSSGTFISTRGGFLAVDKTPVPGNSMDTVVLGHCFENAWYGRDYDPDNPAPPKCFAFGVVKPGMSVEEVQKLQDTMRPHEMSTEPQGGPSGGCADCPQNKFGSSEKGKGKACKNLRRIALIAGDEHSLQDINGQKVYYLKPPVTSSKNWDGYVKDVAKTLRRPPLGIITTVSITPDPKWQFSVNFNVSEKIDNATYFEQLIARANVVATEIDFPYQPATEEEKPAPTAPAKNTGPRKFAPPAKGARR